MELQVYIAWLVYLQVYIIGYVYTKNVQIASPFSDSSDIYVQNGLKVLLEFATVVVIADIILTFELFDRF